MEDIKIENIIKSKRKTIGLEITDRATLIVRVPYHISKKTINEVIQKHKNWIEKHINKIKSRPKVTEKEYVSGENFLLLGRNQRLLILEKQSKKLMFDNAFYLRADCRTNAKEILEQWYRKRAKEFIGQRVNYYSKLTGINYKSIRITGAKKRWGSCSKEGNLSFTYRLIMAPVSVIDYVVVHELCHIELHNHSKAFWEKVRVIIPEYKKQKGWLNENGFLLNL